MGKAKKQGKQKQNQNRCKQLPETCRMTIYPYVCNAYFDNCGPVFHMSPLEMDSLRRKMLKLTRKGWQLLDGCLEDLESLEQFRLCHRLELVKPV